jgi:hypothetical protein
MATNAWSDAAPGSDPAERVATVAQAKRELLLAVNRTKLPREELEDCYAQATLELVVRARRDPFVSDLHAANALEQKFASRITDRVRAISGRSPIAAILRGAASLDEQDADNERVAVVDCSARVEPQALARHDLRALRELAGELTEDQRLVLACQVSLGMDCAEFCARYGWSAEKFRKVAQRARAKLRSLLDDYDQGERCRALEPALLAVASRVAHADEEARVRAHASNCLGCARTLRDLRAAECGVAAALPVPALVSAGLVAKLGALSLAVRRLLHLAPSADAAGGGATAAGGSALSIGAAKLGVTALCVAGAAGSYAVCSTVGALPGAVANVSHGHVARLAPKPGGAGAPIRPPAAHFVGTPAGASQAQRRLADEKRHPGPRARSSEFAAVRSDDQARHEFEAASAAAAAAPTTGSAHSSAEASQEFATEFGP